MTPLRMRLRNFRSFRAEQVLEFPQEPGLYFLSGTNELEPRLDANGAGKSTLTDALCWLFFERTPRGLKAGDVCSWGEAGGTRVELDFVAGSSEECTVRRTWKPNAWTLHWAGSDHQEDLAKSLDNPVLGWLSLEMQPFLSCVLMAQGQGMFLDMKATAQAELFGSLMDLDRWVGYSADAGAMERALGDRARALDRLLGAAQARVESLGRGDLKRAQEAWYAERSQKLDDLGRQHEQAIEHSYAKQDLRAAQDAEDAAFAAMRAASPDPDDEADVRELREILRETEKDYAVLEHRLADAEEQLGRAERGEDCRECGQSLGTPAHKRDARRKWDALGLEVERVGAMLNDARDAVAEAGEQAEAARKRWEGLRDLAQDAQAATRRARTAKEAEDRMLDAIEDEAAALEKTRNPHDAAVARLEQDLADAEDEEWEARRELDDVEHRRSVAAYWMRGFKEVRLALVAEALTELEVEVNSCCEALGLVGWELRFRVDRETKGGGVQRGFSVLVRSPASPDLVPWEAWSGGESQRLRVAAQMGLADLIRARTGATVPLEIWDEPTAGLSGRGVQDLLEAMAQRARAEGRCVWLIDHRTHAFGGFAGGARVVKDAGGSRIEQDGV